MTGGRNKGCEALVSSIIEGLRGDFPAEELKIDLHSRDPKYDRWQFQQRVDQVYWSYPLLLKKHFGSATLNQMAYKFCAAAEGFLPGRLSASTFTNLKKSDLIIATGGDVFTSDYGGLQRHGHILHAGAPVALLAHTIGPFAKAEEAYFKASMKNVVICTARETETFNYLQDIAPGLQAELTADVAFLLPVTDTETSRWILEDLHHFSMQGKRLMGLSVSGGVLGYRKDVDASSYVTELVAFVDRMNEDGWSVVLIPHVQETLVTNNDMYTCFEVLKKCKAASENVILSLPMSSSDFKGVIGLCDVLVGARTHTTIASMSQGIPTVAIAYSRKAWGIMRDYYGADFAQKVTLEVSRLSCDSLLEAVQAAVSNGRTDATAHSMKERAARNFQLVREFLNR